jgi:hypothetical protein
MKRLPYHEIDGGVRRSICQEMYFSKPDSPFTYIYWITGPGA